MIIFFALLVILSTSLYAFYPSFNLAVFGDFWVTVWRYERMVGEFSIGIWNHFSYFFTLYGPQDIISGLLFNIFHYDSSPYYIFSYLLRLLASASFYPLTFYLTRNKFASFFAVLFFSITSIGLQTTDWVFNMPSYLTIGLFNLFLYFFLISRNNYRVKYVIFFTLFFFITLVISPIRSMSIVPFIIIIEIIWLICHQTFADFKKVIIRLSIVLLIYVLMLTQTTLFTSPDWDIQTVTPATSFLVNGTFDSFKGGYDLVRSGKGDFILNPIITIGGMFIPNLSVNNKSLSLLIGSLSIIIWLVLIVLNKKSKIRNLLIISFIWTLVSFLIPWMRREYLTVVFPTDQRYLILPAVGIALLFAGIITLVKNKSFRYIVYLLLSIILILNIYTTRAYFKSLDDIRSKQLYNKIWSQLPEFKNIGKTKGPLVFYFTGERGEIIHNSLEFGFPSKLQLIYHIPDFKTVITIDNLKDLISAVKDGKLLAKFGVLPRPLPSENIYSFNLEGTDKLVNTTDMTRGQILKALE